MDSEIKKIRAKYKSLNQIPTPEMCKQKDENVCYMCMRYSEFVENGYKCDGVKK